MGSQCCVRCPPNSAPIWFKGYRRERLRKMFKNLWHCIRGDLQEAAPTGDDRYLNLIDFFLKKEGKSFSEEEIREHAGLKPKEMEVISETILIPEKRGHSPQESVQWALAPEGFFGYLSYLQYKHSVKSIRQAQCLALSSIAISSLLLLLNIMRNLKDTHFVCTEDSRTYGNKVGVL